MTEKHLGAKQRIQNALAKIYEAHTSINRNNQVLLDVETLNAIQHELEMAVEVITMNVCEAESALGRLV